MPDWIIHMGSSAAFTPTLNKNDFKWLLLGSVLPDVISRTAYAAFDLIGRLLEKIAGIGFPLSYTTLHTAFHFYHTPFVCLLLTFAAAFLSKTPRRTAGLLTIGFILHFLLDAFQKSAYGGGSSLLFPFDLTCMNSGVIWYESLPLLPMTVISLLLIILSFKYLNHKFKNTIPDFPVLTKKRVVTAVFIFVIAIIFPFFYMKQALRENVNHVLFLSHQKKYINQKIGLLVSEVISINPLTVKEGTNRFVIIATPGMKRDNPEKNKQIQETIEGLLPGDYLSVTGIYSPAGVNALDVHKHHYITKAVNSIAAMILLLYLFAEPVFRVKRPKSNKR